MLTKLAELYNRQDIVDGYMYGVFNYISYFELLSRFKIDEYKSYRLRIIKIRSYVVNCFVYISYNIDNKIHKDNDIPAIKCRDGSRHWYQNGELHRDNDKPAIECVDGSKSWWQNGKRHRYNDNPAIEYANGTKFWYQNDELHRDNDKPAEEWADGTKAWYQNGKRHRDNDKPAIEHANGTKIWYQNGKFIRHSKIDFLKSLKHVN